MSLFTDKDSLLKTFTKTPLYEESENSLLSRLHHYPFARLRQFHAPTKSFLEECHQNNITVLSSKYSNIPSLEIAYLMTEISISRKAHRYGNLSLQDKHPLQIPKPIYSSTLHFQEQSNTKISKTKEIRYSH